MLPFNYSAVADSNFYKNMNTTWRKFLAKKFGATYTKAYEKFRKEEIKNLNEEIR